MRSPDLLRRTVDPETGHPFDWSEGAGPGGDDALAEVPWKSDTYDKNRWRYLEKRMSASRSISRCKMSCIPQMVTTTPKMLSFVSSSPKTQADTVIVDTSLKIPAIESGTIPALCMILIIGKSTSSATQHQINRLTSIRWPPWRKPALQGTLCIPLSRGLSNPKSSRFRKR